MNLTERPLTVLQFGMTYAPMWRDGGPPRIMYDYARHLIAEGFQVMVLTGDSNRPKPEDNWAGFPPGLEVHYVRKLGGWRSQYYFDFSWAELTRFFDEHWWRIDFIHLYQTRSIFNVAALWASYKYGLKIVLSSFGSMPRRGSVSKLFYDSLFVFPLTHRAELLLAQTRNECGVYRQYGGRRAHIQLLPLAVDLAKLPRLEPDVRSKFRDRYSIPAEARLFLFLGRLHPTKGVEFLVDCFALAVKEAPGAHLAIVGHDEGSAAEVIKAIKANQLEGRVVLCGPLYDLDRWQAYAAADCFVILPQIFEETSLASLEALACGTPVITNERADVPWLEEYGAGRVVPAGDAIMAAEAMVEVSLADTPALAVRRAAASRLIAERFSIEGVSHQFGGLLNSAVRSRAKLKRGPLLIGPLPGAIETSGQAVCFKLLVDGLTVRGLAGPVVNLGSGLANQTGGVTLGRALEYIAIFTKVALHCFPRTRVVYLTMAQSKHGFLRDAVIIALAKLSGNEVVLHLNGGNYANFYNSESPAIQWAIRKALRQTKSIVVLSDRLRDCFAFDPALRKKIRVVQNSLPAGEMPERAPVRAVRSEGELTILYLSNLIESKGYLEVLEVVKFLQEDERIECRALFCGSFLANPSDDVRIHSVIQAREYFHQRAAELGVASRISYCGSVGGADKDRVLAESDFLVLPTRYDNEGQPVVLIEALAHGLPAIATDYRANSEMVVEGETGGLVDWRDTAGMARKIAELWRNPSTYARMSVRCRKRFEERFTPKAHIDAMEEVLFNHSE
ncbi:MAG: glycosyltransferase family 4 protein [Lacunisphaera sp.]|nr:glycosyltransferase family 4 protein [Lacunisphaera sp.]